VGCFYVEIERLSSRELFSISVLAIFNVKAQVPMRTSTAAEQVILEKQTFFSCVPHSGGTSVSSAGFFFEYGVVRKDNFGTSRFHCHQPLYKLFISLFFPVEFALLLGTPSSPGYL